MSATAMADRPDPGALVSTADLSADEIADLFGLARQGKADNWAALGPSLRGRVVGLLFFNSSLRTRSSFQSGVARLGGSSVVINPGEAYGIAFEDGVVMDGAEAEHVKEAGGVLSQYFDAVGIRSFPAMRSWEEDRRDRVIAAFRRHLSVPLVNMESCLWHPCQALADGLTLTELFGERPRGRKFVLSWANHPKNLPTAVPNSALVMGAQLGMDVTLACPEGYDLDAEIMSLAREHCGRAGARFEVCHSQPEAFTGADAVYAKAYTPPRLVGRPEDAEREARAAGRWTVSPELMARTRDAVFMHCLPVRRNVVVEDAVLDSPQSVVLRQAVNRMHVQNAVLLRLLGIAV